MSIPSQFLKGFSELTMKELHRVVLSLIVLTVWPKASWKYNWLGNLLFKKSLLSITNILQESLCHLHPSLGFPQDCCSLVFVLGERFISSIFSISKHKFLPSYIHIYCVIALWNVCKDAQEWLMMWWWDLEAVL